MNFIYIRNTALKAFASTAFVLLLVILNFFAFEPSIIHSQTTDFNVTQVITEEVSFLVTPGTVGMAGSIAGLTGGYATGTAVAVVTTNDPLGYNMTLGFSDTIAMHLNGSGGSSYISNYTPSVANVPDFEWATNSSGGAAEFGYTVRASTTGDVDQSFQNNGSACNTGSTETDNRCWHNPSTTPETIINTSDTAAYSTTTVKFKVAVPSSPSPLLPAGTYTATATLTIATNT